MRLESREEIPHGMAPIVPRSQFLMRQHPHPEHDLRARRRNGCLRKLLSTENSLPRGSIASHTLEGTSPQQCRASTLALQCPSSLSNSTNINRTSLPKNRWSLRRIRRNRARRTMARSSRPQTRTRKAIRSQRHQFAVKDCPPESCLATGDAIAGSTTLHRGRVVFSAAQILRSRLPRASRSGANRAMASDA